MTLDKKFLSQIEIETYDEILQSEPEVCRDCGEQFGEHKYWCIESQNERRNDRFTDRMAIILRQPIELEVA